MPLFATCTIANAILALCAPPGALSFSSWVRAVPLRFDTLASYKLARRIPGVCCRALRVSAARQSAGAMLAVLCARWPATPQRWCAPCAWAQVWRVRAAARVAAQLRPRSATATARRRIWLAPWAKLSMRTISMDLTGHWRPGMAQRTRRVDGTAQWLPHQQSLPDGLCHVCARAARQRAALRLAATIVHVAHDYIANP